MGRIISLSCISDVAYMKILLHLLFVIFSSVHKILYIVTHLSLIDWSFLSNNICLHILVNILLWVQLGTIWWQKKDLNAVFIFCQTLVEHFGFVRWMPIGYKVYFLSAVFYHLL